MVVRWLHRSARVLLLDNFEHLLGAASQLPGLLDAGPDLKLLVTSQAPLRLAAERVVNLSPLALPEPGAERAAAEGQPAVAFDCDRARAANHQFRLEPGNVVSSDLALPRA